MLARRATLLPSASRTAVCSRNSRSRIRQRGSRISSPGLRGTAKHYPDPIAVAMEGYNGHVRPLDSLVKVRGWRLFNVNNLKLARFKEIFPAAAKSDRIDSTQDAGAVPAPRSPADGPRCAAGSHGNPCRERHPQAPVAAPASPGERTHARDQFSARRSSGRGARAFADHPLCRQPLVPELSDLPQGHPQARPAAPYQPTQAAWPLARLTPIAFRLGSRAPTSVPMPAWSAI